MPYSIVKVEGKYRLKNKSTGKLLPGGSDSEEEAEARRRAIMAKENQSVQVAFEPFSFKNGEPIKIIPEGSWYRGDRKLHITKQLLEEVQNNFEQGLPQYRVGFYRDHVGDRGKVGNINKIIYSDTLPTGPGLYATEYDFTPKGLKIIDEDGYDGVSAEIIWELAEDSVYVDPETGEEYDNVLVGVALTPQPFFGHGQVALYSATPTSKKAIKHVDKWMYDLLQEFRPKAFDMLFGKEGDIEDMNAIEEKLTEMVKEAIQMDELEKIQEELDAKAEELEGKDGELETLTDELSELRKEIDELQSDDDADKFVSKSDYEKLSAEHDKLNAEVRSERLASEVTALKALVLDKDEYIEKMSALEDKDSELAEWVKAKFGGVDKALAEAGIFEEFGNDHEDTANTLDALAQQKIKSDFAGDESKYAEALALVAKEHPELVDEL